MKLSIILPVYGVEKYIEKCLLSCINQADCSPTDYEIVIVDDSSPDNSIAIARTVIEKYPDHNIKIVSRSNGGLSAARNTGIENASGEYIWFVDSDDYIEAKSVATLFQAIQQSGKAPVISFSHQTVFPTHVIKSSMPEDLVDRLTHGIEFVERTNFYSACSRIYSADFLRRNNMSFLEGILWEDGEFNLRLFPLVERHFCIGDCLYNYLRREGSISSSPKNIIKTLDSNLIRFKTIYDWVSSLELTDKQRRIINTRLTEIVMLSAAELSEIPKGLRKVYRERLVRLKPVYRKVVTRCSDFRYSMIGLCILLSPTMMSRLLANKYHRAINSTYANN